MDKLSDALNATLLKIASKELVEENMFTEFKPLILAGLITHQHLGGWAISEKGVEYLSDHHIHATVPNSDTQ